MGREKGGIQKGTGEGRVWGEKGGGKGRGGEDGEKGGRKGKKVPPIFQTEFTPMYASLIRSHAFPLPFDVTNRELC